MAITKVMFSEWLPDQPGVVGALTNAKNVYPRATGYGPFPQEADYSASASQSLNNIAAARGSDGSMKVFAGGSTKLFRLDGTDYSLDDVSLTTYSDVTRWRFTQFGDSLIAAGYPNTMQRYNMNGGSAFENLASDAPRAKFVTIVRDFVVGANTSDSSTRVQWSGINDETVWTTTSTSQSDYQEIPDGGAIQGITGGEFGLVLLERSIYRMTYVGTPLIFQFDNITRNLGCYEPNSVVQWNGVTYFLSDDGFYACDGQSVVDIGAEKINRYFFNTVQKGEYDKMSAAVDPSKALIIWGYLCTDTTYRLLVYHVPTKRWSYVDTGINRISSVATPGITLEGLDAFSASIDDLLIPLDSNQWVGDKMQLAGVSGAKIVTFNGLPKTGVIDTADIETGPNKSMVTLVKPIVDNGSGSCAVDSRDLLNQEVEFPSVTAADSENRIGVRSLGRYHRVRTTPTGDNWSSAIGVEIEIQNAGFR